MKTFFLILLSFPVFALAKTQIIVLDSGIELEHKILKNNIKIIDKEAQVLVVGDYDGLGSGASADSHGTHVAGIIVQEFSGAEIVPLKNLPGPTSSFGTATPIDSENLRFNKALAFAIKHKIRLINFSQVMGLTSEETIQSLKDAEAAGIIVVTAVGNSLVDLDSRFERLSKEKKVIGTEEARFIYPCGFKFPNVICVGNYDKNGKKREVVSNFGTEYVDVLAYGQEILSSCNKGTMCRKSGSSMSTPRITARLGKIWSKNPSWTYQQVKAQLFKELPTDAKLKPFSKTGAYLD